MLKKNLIKQKIKQKIKNTVPQFIINYIRKLQDNIRNDAKPVRKLLRFEINLTDHCNLNCKCCSHYSPLAKENFYNIDSLERDFQQLSQLADKKVNFTINLIGGEPLLHPQLIDIMMLCRKYFDSDVIINTNGVLLLKQSAEFWTTCQNLKIDISVSIYPIKIDIEKITQISQQYGVNFQTTMLGLRHQWFNLNKDCRGQQNKKHSFANCTIQCVTLENGKLYACTAPCLAKHFNAYFGETFKVSEKDYIDIYKVKNSKQIRKFISRPIPFCRYCRPQEYKSVEWGPSKKEMEEWI